MKTNDLEDVYQRYYQALFLYAFSLTRNKADAEDLTANAFVKALLSFEDGSIQSWLYVVLKNEFYNLYQKKKHYYENYELDRIESSINIIDELFEQERKAWLYKRIYELPTQEQEIMLLSLQSELDDSMIAKIMNIRVENVRVIRYRTKKKLMKLYEEEWLL